ncbi:uncharacterized protein BJ171DRAFT_3247 [Polychytrium aggregatum]|uniref:uncharacterized protein n=1 Tax=Polychytrium aggregatum TaxID=110093 RepID=UPI0022FE4E91|nr:uncharacterized protein BJ171DRAFT_3247 [Polychytrium aggregatum]KAI9209569.1 hypothetical protein BJ171DRAFT_3247 [Polychytrium aggregatum]
MPMPMLAADVLDSRLDTDERVRRLEDLCKQIQALTGGSAELPLCIQAASDILRRTLNPLSDTHSKLVLASFDLLDALAQLQRTCNKPIGFELTSIDLISLYDHQSWKVRERIVVFLQQQIEALSPTQDELLNPYKLVVLMAVADDVPQISRAAQTTAAKLHSLGTDWILFYQKITTLVRAHLSNDTAAENASPQPEQLVAKSLRALLGYLSISPLSAQILCEVLDLLTPIYAEDQRSDMDQACMTDCKRTAASIIKHLARRMAAHPDNDVSESIAAQAFAGLLGHTFADCRIASLALCQIFLDEYYAPSTDQVSFTGEVLTGSDSDLGSSGATAQPVELVTCWTSLLVVPVEFGGDVEEAPDDRTLRCRAAFKEHASDILKMLAMWISRASAVSARKHEFEVLTVISSFLGDRSGRWTSDLSRTTVEAILKALSGDSADEIVKRNFGKTLRLLQPHFAKSSRIQPANLEAQLARRQPVEIQKSLLANTSVEDGYYTLQDWKMKRVDAVEILAWQAQFLEQTECDEHLHELVPITLTLMDDHQVRYKLEGTRILRRVLQHVSPERFRRMGIGSVFSETLHLGWNYFNEHDLMNESLWTSYELSSVMFDAGSMEQYESLERLLKDGIMTGLSMSAGGKVADIQMYLRILQKVLWTLGVTGIRFMKPTLGYCCDLLKTHRFDLQTQLVASETIVIVIRLYWMRVKDYRGMIYASVAENWRQLEVDQHNSLLRAAPEVREALQAKLRRILALLKDCLGDVTKPDFLALLALDQKMFGQLLYGL